MNRVTTALKLSRLVGVLSILIAMTGAAQELNENCTVSVLNRNAQVNADGSWILPVVPANFGPVRARATCVENGVTTYGESALFTVPANASVDVPRIQLGHVTPIPDLLTLTTTMTTLRTPRATTPVTVVATYTGGSVRDVTLGAAGTTYTISNPAIATITADGIVTAIGSGTALVQATNEGASGVLAVSVVLSADSDGDGILDDIEIREGLDPHNPADALEDADRDGLSNLDEIRLGTQMRNPDTDGDGIPDGEEVVAGADGFVTNPLLADTDGDGVRDALEIQSGSDPTNALSINLSRALSRIELMPPAFTLTVNTLAPEASTQLTPTGRLLDGYTIDLTSASRGTNYSSSNINVCNFGGQDGRVYAGAEGTCTISVMNSGFTATASGVVRNFSPRQISRINIPGYANNVDVADDVAYVAAGAAGLVIVDVSTASAPVIVGTLDTSGNADDVRVAGRYAYVADGPGGLKIIDVVDPTAPRLVGSVATPGDANDVVVRDNYAYIAAGPAGLVIVDCSNPSAPTVAGQYDTPGYARGVDVSGNVAVVADDSPSTMQVINIANPRSPIFAGSVSLAGNPKDVRAIGNIAYVAAYTGGTHVVDFTTPSAPRRIGGLPGPVSGGFVPQDIEVVGRFALAAEVYFVNGVPIVDVQNPASPTLRGTIDFSSYNDYNGTGIAVSGPYVYMTAASDIRDNGDSGATAFYIGQYLPLEDLAGVPPQVTITSPPASQAQVEGTRVTVSAQATDDIAVSFVQFLIGDQIVFTDTTPPFEYQLTVPIGVSSVTVTAAAADLGGNIGRASVTIPVIADPLTTVSGIVVDEHGAPVVGATVTTAGNRTTSTGAGGAFSIYNVPTVGAGNIVANATALVSGVSLSGSSAPTPPVPGGVTNVGTIRLIGAVWEPNLGIAISNCDDCYYERTLPFSFPYYGTNWTSVWVGTNGYLTFGQGDWTYSESVGGFNNMPRIAPFFDDLYGRSTGAVYVNDQLPGRFVVTWYRVQHYSYGGSNTIQVTLFSDGRIQFAYNGITALFTGTIVGITPRASAPLQQVNYSNQTSVDGAGGNGVYEYFTSSNLFDLDGGFVVFTPVPNGGYSARTVLPAPPSTTLTITGSPSTTGSAAGGVSASSVTAQGNGVMNNAEVELFSSGNMKYRGLTNTDAHGNFTLSGVPAGGISVIVRKHGKDLGYGGLVARGRSDNTQLEIHPPKPEKKSQGQTE